MKNDTQMNGLLSPILQKIRFNQAKKYLAEGKRFLDLGSSLGEVIPYLPENYEYIGIEGSPDYYRNCVKLWPSHAFINKYVTGKNVSRLGLEKNYFDTVIALAVIEHVDEPEKILKGLDKYLAIGGKVLISTPSPLADKIHWLGGKLGLFSNENDEHNVIFTKKELRKLGLVCGYKVVECRSFEFGLNTFAVFEKKG